MPLPRTSTEASDFGPPEIYKVDEVGCGRMEVYVSLRLSGCWIGRLSVAGDVGGRVEGWRRRKCGRGGGERWM